MEEFLLYDGLTLRVRRFEGGLIAYCHDALQSPDFISPLDAMRMLEKISNVDGKSGRDDV